MTHQLELALIVIAVLFGLASATYFYLEAGIFMKSLQKQLRLIAVGMFIISLGVLLSAFISYESYLGVQTFFYNLPATAFFYWLYILGSIFIGFGARQFTHKGPKIS